MSDELNRLRMDVERLRQEGATLAGHVARLQAELDVATGKLARHMWGGPGDPPFDWLASVRKDVAREAAALDA